MQLTARSSSWLCRTPSDRARSVQVMVTNVTSLLKTVKAVEDEHTRGTRALESTIQAIAQEIRVSAWRVMATEPGAEALTACLCTVQALNSTEQQTTSTATAEELVRCTKAITVATARAVAAGNSCRQQDIIVAANMGRKAISDMLTICKVSVAVMIGRGGRSGYRDSRGVCRRAPPTPPRRRSCVRGPSERETTWPCSTGSYCRASCTCPELAPPTPSRICRPSRGASLSASPSW